MELHKIIIHSYFCFYLAIDMALLTLANHSIISHGTFGMWGALLAGRGETIMSKEFLKTDVGEQINDAIGRNNIKNWRFLEDT